MTSRSANLLLLGFSCLISLLLCEIGFRIWNGVSPLDRTNWRDQSVIHINMADGNRYDEVLGWVLKPHLRPNLRANPVAVSTIEHGVRRNGAEHTGVRHGQILAVGSSFAAGSEVTDSQTWPARLEAMLGTPVDNAAVGAYGMDQVVLRAEQLLDALRPKVLLVEAMENTVQWASYSHFTKAKPYFTIAQGKLIAHHSPVPVVERGDRFEPLKTVLGYSFAFHRLMAAVSPEFWFSTPQATIRRIENDPAEVTCALLHRLKQRTDASGIRTLLVLQPGAQDLINGPLPLGLALVAECAGMMGYQVVDLFTAFGSAYRADKKIVNKLYTSHGAAYGHMSEFGNHEVARTVASALKSPAARTFDVSAYKPGAFIAGDGRNLLASREAPEPVFHSSAGGEFLRVANETSEWPHFRLVPRGPKGEHYAATTPIDVAQGPYVISFEVQPRETSGMRVQLLDSKSNGVLLDVDFLQKATKTERVGVARHLRAGIEDLNDGWHKVWASATLAGEKITPILQLAGKDGELVFSASSEALTFRALQLERGQSPSPYKPPAFIAGDGRNLLAFSEALDHVFASSGVAELRPLAKESSQWHFRLVPRGPKGEHYVSAAPIDVPPSPHVISFEVQPRNTAGMRVQLLDSKSSGVLCDVDFLRKGTKAARLGAGQRVHAGIKELSDGWYKVWAGATLPGEKVVPILQLAGKDGELVFSPGGEALTIRAVQLERGESPSPYRPTPLTTSPKGQ